MASKILLKKSTTASSVPTTLDLDVGEVAINTEDKRLFTKDSGGSIVEVSTTPSTMDVDGNATVGGTLNVTGTTTLGTATVGTKLTVPTPVDSTDAATKGYVDTAVTNVIDAAPGALDTLNELAAAIGDDANFSTTVTNSLALKAPLASPALTGTPTAPTAAADTNTTQIATTAYVQTEVADYLPLAGGTMTGDITLGTNAITSTATPATADELTRKGYVDSILGSATDAATSAANAATSATNAATSASNASTSETNAATSAASAAASYDNFDDRYLGAKATAPALDNDGDALVTGALYFDTTVGAMYVYDGSTWGTVAPVATSVTVSQITDLTATATELNYVDGVTSNIQTQIDAIDPDPTKGTLTKTFANGEQASIALSSAVSTAPVVTVTKEVAQTGISSKGAWDVNSTGSNYELHDTAYATTLTPGTIGFQLSEASYASKSFSIASQDTAPSGIEFNSDGTKMYVLGNTNDTVFQYSLSTAYDVSTASYDSVSFSVASQDTNVLDISFNKDGTKMYIAGNGNDNVYQYSLSTAFDLSTASYDSVSFDISSQETVPQGITFNSDGTKMYLTGGTGDDINQYTLSTGFDISTASFDSVTFSVSSQDTNPCEILFNNIGTKMYVLGNTNATVFQYSLSTAFDISTASYDSVSFSVNSQETSVRGMVFSADGTTMYVVGYTSDTVFQYSTSKDGLVLGSGSFASTDVGKRIVGNGGEAILTAADGSYSVVTAFTDSSTIASGSWSMYALDVDATNGITLSSRINGFDITNASYDSVSFSVASEDTVPLAIALNNDGTKMYIVGNSGDNVNQYTLSTAYDLSTASFDSVIFSVASQETAPNGITFNNNGTKMYIVGTGTDTVYQYSLSTAFDLSTASYDSQSANVTSQATLPSAVKFNSDGTKMYVLDYGSDVVYQYTLASAYLVSTASYDSVSFNANSQATVARDFVFNANGTKMLILDQTTASVFQYSLATAFDISTASYDSVSFSVTSQESLPQGFAFNNTGTTMYIVGSANDTVHQYTTGTTYVPTSQYSPAVTSASGQIDSAFWTDINTMTVDETLNGGNAYYAVSTDNRTTWAVIDDTDGVRPIVRNNSGTWQYNNATTYSGTTWVNATTNEELYALQEALEDGNAEEASNSVSNWAYSSVSFSVASQDGLPLGIAFNNDGTKMYLSGSGADSIYQYSLSTAFDLSTASYDSVSLSVSSQTGGPSGLIFNSDGTKMYVSGTYLSASVFQYSLSTAFDLSTASYDSVSLSVSSQETDPTGLSFNNNGTKLYVVGAGSDSVFQYTLSTAYDLSTASYDSVSLSVSAQDANPSEVKFNSDGTTMYVLGRSNGNVYQYTLSTAYDLSTASYASVSFSVSGEESLPQAFVFNSSRTKMYLVGQGNDTVYQYFTANQLNRMDSTQLDAVTDPNHYTLGDTLDLAIILYTASAGSIPTSDGVTINYDAEALNQGAVVGTDYDFDFPNSTTVRITSNAAQNLKVRVV